MKKFTLFLILSVAFGLRSNAQTVTLALITPPCDSNGVVVATFTGLTTPYDVQWSSSTSYITHYGVTGVTDTFKGFGGGGVTVEGYDSLSGAYAYTTASYSAPFTVVDSGTNAVCPALGTLGATVTGGSGSYTYQWLSSPSYSIVATSNPASVPAGYYYVKVTDVVTGCVQEVLDSPISINITPDFTTTVTTTAADCTNGTATVTIGGGTAPFSYLWSNGATTASIAGLVTNYYYVRVTDALGCTNDSGTVGGYVAQAITITVNDAATPATCLDSNGSIIAFGSGGTPPYTYLWSNGATTQTISGMPSNYYDVTVTDANGCLGWGDEYLSASTPITATYTSTASLCTSPTGTASLTLSGGTTPYNVLWYTSPPQTGLEATALSAGNYYFNVTDALGCVQSGAVPVPSIETIGLSFGYSAATCLESNGAVSAAAYGGVSPYHYLWNTGSTATSLTAIPAGSYNVTVTDANGCSAANGIYVPYNSPITLGLSSTEASCIFNSDGSITALASLGTPPYSYSMGGSSSGAVTIPGLATGAYWIYVTDAHGCNAEQYTYVGYNASDNSCYCTINGTVYDDLALDCSPTGDPGIQNIQLQCSGIGYTYTNPDGNYSFIVPSGAYTISQTVLGMYPLSACQPNNIPVTVTASSGCTTTVNFADTVDPIHDIHISTWDYTFPVPGFTYTQAVVVTNDGTVNEPGITSAYTTDGQIFSPSFVPGGVFSGAPYYYNATGTFPALTPGTGQEFFMTYNVPADIPLATNLVFQDTAAYTPPMANWLNDYSPWNNVNYFTTSTVGSYDPNFKEVSPKGSGTQGYISTNDSVLEYMIHFQNIGSYMAQNVVVRDTIDANLDWTTLRPVFMSDKCTVDIDEHGDVTFTFNNIDLPPVSSEPISSNAMFTYTVKQRPGLDTGTQIKNRASIYFDYNAPVRTNQTLNTIGTPTKTPNVQGPSANNAFTIFPNPAQNTFTASVNVSNAGAYKLSVTDVTGKTDITKTLSLLQGARNVTVDASRLAPGIYFVTLSGNDNFVQTQKLVIIK